MSIALGQKVKELEQRIAELEAMKTAAVLEYGFGSALWPGFEAIDKRIKALEEKRKPGRPRKNG